MWHRTDHIRSQQHHLTLAIGVGTTFGRIASERSHCHHDPYPTSPHPPIQRDQRCSSHCTRPCTLQGHLSALQLCRRPNSSSIHRPSGQLGLSHSTLSLPILPMPMGGQYCRRCATVGKQANWREATSQGRNVGVGSVAVRSRGVAADFGARPAGRLQSCNCANSCLQHPILMVDGPSWTRSGPWALH